MNPDDEDAIINQLKQPKVVVDAAPKIDIDFLKTCNNRNIGNYAKTNSATKLQVFAENEVARKEYKELRCEMPGIPRSTFLVVFSPDGTKAASTHGNHNIYVTDLRSGKNLKTLVGHPRTPWCIAFHPTSNQLIASGCLGGQVRIWDLSGGSEIWTAENQTVIASIAFHPSDRLLAIATFNELYFWDWSKPTPYLYAATSNPREKVRFVAFDKLGHKLITGIANTPQSRWDRARGSVPVPEASYRRRLAQRCFFNYSQSGQVPSTNGNNDRAPLTSVPERERRITACYRNLVHEYELLVHRYLQVYRPPATMDRGTDPMEFEPQPSTSGIQTPGPSTSTNQPNSTPASISTQSSSNTAPVQSTSGTRPDEVSARTTPLLVPSELCSLRRHLDSLENMCRRNISRSQTPKPETSARSSATQSVPQTPPVIRESNLSPGERRTDPVVLESPSSPTEENSGTSTNVQPQIIPTEVPSNNEEQGTSQPSGTPPNQSTSPALSNAVRHFINLFTTQPSNDANPSYIRRRLLVRTTLGTQTSTESTSEPSTSGSNTSDKAVYKMRIKCSPRKRSNSNHLQDRDWMTMRDKVSFPKPKPESSPQSSSTVTETLLNTSNRDRSSIMASRFFPANLGNASNFDHNRPRTKRLYSGFAKKNNRRSVIDVSSDSSSSGDESNANRKRIYSAVRIPSSTGGGESTSSNKQNLKSDETSKQLIQQYCGRCAQSGTTEGVSDSSWINAICTAYDNNRRKLFRRNSFNSETVNQENNDTNKTCTKCGGKIDVCRSSPASPESPTTAKVTSALPNEPTVEVNAENPISTNFESPRLPTVMSTGLTSSNNSQSDLGVHQISPNTSNNDITISSSANRNDTAELDTSTSSQNSVPNDTGTNVDSRIISEPCARTLMNTDTSTTNSTVYTRRRFFSQRLSAFQPTRVHNVRPQSRLRRASSYLSPAMRSRLGNLNSLDVNNRQGSNFASDEVINYSERVNAEDDPAEQPLNTSEFHPFDPPPEFPTINLENIGIGNMYSNIVQDLESSLNNVRNIRASNRPGETSDMLSSFSERLESIMQQSDSILRNLRHSMDMLPPHNADHGENRNLNRWEFLSHYPSPRGLDSPQFAFNDPHFYIRDHSRLNNLERARELLETSESTSPRTELYTNRSAIASDHTYPRNPESPRTLPATNDNMIPLMTSLHLTISHIQRQASLLRQQVESIERIDRAMLEVAQLQMIRQMFEELRGHLINLATNESRSAGVSSVRQMMAGTRISDSSPYDSPVETPAVRNRPPTIQPNNTPPPPSSSSTSPNTSGEGLPLTSHSQILRRGSTRKSFPPSRLHLQRQNRRLSVVSLLQRRYIPRERFHRRRNYFRTITVRPITPGVPINVLMNVRQPNDHDYNVTHINSDTLLAMTRRLEHLLTEQIRLMANLLDCDNRNAVPNRHDGEHSINERLNACRLRISRLLFHSHNNTSLNRSYRIEAGSVTQDGISRFNARDTLSQILDTLSRFLEENSNTTLSHSLRIQIRSVIDLTLLLADILLLHIVDSIPPPTGMNLEPERESLSARIEQMCSRVLQSRTGHSHALSRSLRLMRLIARYATRALRQTYTARRNAILPCGNNDRRRELIGQINNTLRNMHRTRGMPYTPVFMPVTGSSTNSQLPTREWYNTLYELVSRYNAVSSQPHPPLNTYTPSRANANESGRTRNPVRYEEPANSDDNEDNEPDWYNNNLPPEPTRPLYRTSNMNLLNGGVSSPSSSQSRPWNVPTVQINDVPISESSSVWTARLFPTPMYRLSDLRSNPTANVFRPRFLHPLYTGLNPFESDLDDPQREQIYDNDMIPNITPNHRIQAWDISSGIVADISNQTENVVVSECKIHNDASVDIANDGTLLVTLLPSGGYNLNSTNRLGVYSLRWETLGQCLYVTSFEQNAVSVSLSPLSRHLVVGLAARRVSILPNEKWTMARIFLLDQNQTPYGSSRLPLLRELEQNRDTNYMSLNCIRWLPVSGQGLIYATNTGQLRILS